MVDDISKLVISGEGFVYAFDKNSGTLSSMQVKGKELIRRGAELNVWRAPLANETDEWGYWRANNKHNIIGNGRMAATEWYSSGLNNLQVQNESFSFRPGTDNDLIVDIRNVTFLGTHRGAFLNHYKYTIKSNGELVIDHSVVPDGDMPSWLPQNRC